MGTWNPRTLPLLLTEIQRQSARYQLCTPESVFILKVKDVGSAAGRVPVCRDVLRALSGRLDPKTAAVEPAFVSEAYTCSLR